MTWFAKPDSLDLVKKDQAFCDELLARLRKAGDGNRVWVSYRDLQKLRRLTNTSGSDKKKNRRLRVVFLQELLAKAENCLAERAGVLVAKKLDNQRPKMTQEERANSLHAQIAQSPFKSYIAFRLNPKP